MKLRHLLSASLLCGFGMAGARDVHGVKGYYNWTPLQMQASSVVLNGNLGVQISCVWTSICCGGGV